MGVLETISSKAPKLKNNPIPYMNAKKIGLAFTKYAKKG